MAHSVMSTREHQPAFPVSSDWRKHAFNEIEKARDLGGRGGRFSSQRPSPQTFARARDLVNAIQRAELPLPIASAGPDGVLVIEWQIDRSELVFYVFDDSHIEVFVSAPKMEAQEETLSGVDQANQFVDRFVAGLRS
jgi:hypothetical protein